MQKKNLFFFAFSSGSNFGKAKVTKNREQNKRNLTNGDGIATHERSTRLQVVHQGLVLELTLEISGVTNAVPGLYADKGSLLAIRTPEGTDGCLVVYRYCWFTIGIQQHGTVCLTIVDFYAVISEKVIRNLHDAHIGIQRHLHHVMTAVGIALQHVHGLLIIQLDDTFQFTTGHIEGRMTTNLEVNLLAVSILYMPYHMNTVPLQAVSNSEVKTIRINLQPA